MTKLTSLFLVAALLFMTFGLVPIGSARAAIGQPVVSLSSYAPGAVGVQYTITFGLGQLTTSDIGRIDLRHVQLAGGLTSNMNPYSGLNLSVNGQWTNPQLLQTFRQEGVDPLNPDDYMLSVVMPAVTQSSTVTIVLPAGIGLVNPAAQSTWSADSHYINNPAQNQWTIGVDVYDTGSTKVDAKDSAPYSLLAPGVHDASTVVTPSAVGSAASWDVSFTTGPSGSLTGGSGGTIDVQFPLGFTVPGSINAGAVNIRVGATSVTSASVSVVGQMVSVYLPSTFYVAANTSVHVLIQAGAGILNTVTPGIDYKLLIRTTADNVLVYSAAFQIASSQVAGLVATVSPATVSSTASYSLSMQTSAAGALAASTATISVYFPIEVTLPSSILAGQVTVNSVLLSSAPQVTSRTVTLRVPQNIAANSPVSVVFLSGAGIHNPSVAGSYALSASTSADPGTVSAGFSVSASKMSAASVTVTPDTTNAAALYVLSFNLGSSGSLFSGNQIMLSFPTGAQIPASLLPSAFSINGRVLTQAPVVNGTKVSLAITESIAANSQVVVVIAAAAGIRNPRSSGAYTIGVSTTAETVPVDSLQFTVRDGARTSLVVTPQAPDGTDGYYVTQPKVVIVGTAPSGLVYSIKYRIDQGEFRTYVVGAELAITEGQHTIEYYAEDSSGSREDTKSAQFKVFLGKPTVVITAPVNNSVVHSASVVVSGTASGATGVTVNGESVVLAADGSFSHNVTLAAEGLTSIKVRATNQAGGTVDSTVSVTYTRQVRILLQVDYTKAYVNDAEVVLDAPPTIQKGRVLVPVRFISETLGFGVVWDPIFGIVTIQADGKTMRLQVGNPVGDVFGKATHLDVTPTMIGGRLFIHLSLVGTSFGASVVWDAALRVVRITYPAS